MGFDALILLLLLAATLALFLFEVLPVEVTALCLLAAMLLTGLVPLDEAVAGFSNKGVLVIGGLFVLFRTTQDLSPTRAALATALFVIFSVAILLIA